MQMARVSVGDHAAGVLAAHLWTQIHTCPSCTPFSFLLAEGHEDRMAIVASSPARGRQRVCATQEQYSMPLVAQMSTRLKQSKPLRGRTSAWIIYFNSRLPFKVTVLNLFCKFLSQGLRITFRCYESYLTGQDRLYLSFPEEIIS